MQARYKLYILVFLLTVLGTGLTLYKHLVLGFPLVPGDRKQVWTIEAKIDFIARGEPVIVSFALPEELPGSTILEENFASSDYGFSELNDSRQRRAVWSKRDATGPQTVYYRLQVFADDRMEGGADPTPPAAPREPEFEEPFKTAALTLLDQVRERSANNETFARELLNILNGRAPSQNLQLLLNDYSSSSRKADLMTQLLAQEGITSRVARGLYLEDGRRRQSLSDFVEVYQDGRWLLFDPETGNQGIPEDFLLWQRGGQSLLDVIGGSRSRVSFSIIGNTRATKNLAVRYGKDTQAGLIDFSIYSLPIEEQNAYKSILLVPIGALVVVIMRILIGVRTSGTFMPILIALALIQTTLVTGLLIFLVVVGTGLLIRSYLSKLNLLLVARISAVIMVVIAIMAGISIVSNKLGFSQALTVTFFPMIILAWTIERMSILWEEEGAKEVMIQGSGSLVVAVIAYLFMTNSVVAYLTFNFPELLLVNLALILMLGQYTGYRLSELRRFRSMTANSESK